MKRFPVQKGLIRNNTWTNGRKQKQKKNNTISKPSTLFSALCDEVLSKPQCFCSQGVFFCCCYLLLPLLGGEIVESVVPLWHHGHQGWCWCCSLLRVLREQRPRPQSQSLSQEEMESETTTTTWSTKIRPRPSTHFCFTYKLCFFQVLFIFLSCYYNSSSCLNCLGCDC